MVYYSLVLSQCFGREQNVFLDILDSLELRIGATPINKSSQRKNAQAAKQKSAVQDE